MQTQSPVQILFVPPWLQKYITQSDEQLSLNSISDYMDLVTTADDILYFDAAQLWFVRCLCNDIIWTKLDDSNKPVITTVPYRSVGYDTKVTPYEAMTLDLDNDDLAPSVTESRIYNILNTASVKVLTDGNIVVTSDMDVGDNTQVQNLSGLRKDVLSTLATIRAKSNVIETRLFYIYLKNEKPIPVRRSSKI